MYLLLQDSINLAKVHAKMVTCAFFQTFYQHNPTCTDHIITVFQHIVVACFLNFAMEPSLLVEVLCVVGIVCIGVANASNYTCYGCSCSSALAGNDWQHCFECNCIACHEQCSLVRLLHCIALHCIRGVTMSD